MMENDDTAMDLRLRNLETLAQLSITMSQIAEENVRQMRENQIRSDAVMQQIIQLVATMQAEIVRIDETHS